MLLCRQGNWCLEKLSLSEHIAGEYRNLWDRSSSLSQSKRLVVDTEISGQTWKLLVLWFDDEGSCVWTLGSQWVTLFGKAVELLGGTFLREVDQEKWALRVYRLLSLLVQSFLTNCSWNGINQAPTPATVPSPAWWTMSLQTASQNTSSLKLSLVRCFVTRMRTEAKAIRELDFFFLRCGRIKLKEGAERKSLTLYPMLVNGILGDLSYGGNKNWKIIKRFCHRLEEVGIGAL